MTTAGSDEKRHAMHNASSSKQWLNCDLWYHFKVAAEAAGEDYNPERPASRRGSGLHEIAEHAFGKYWFEGDDLEHALGEAWRTRKSYVSKRFIKDIGKDDEEQVSIAVHAMAELCTEDMEVDLELEVPLIYEPGSVGHVDLAGLDRHGVLTADYKFGEMQVSPNDTQLKIYAASQLALLKSNGVKLTPDMRVRTAIIQPRHHREALVRVFDVVDILKFMAYVEGVVAQQVEGWGLRGAGTLRSCEWCPFDDRCTHRVQLVNTYMKNASTDGQLTDKVTEEIVRSRGAFKKVIESCVARVVAEEDRFPNWRRVEVSNAAKWSPLLEDSEIESRLLAKNAKGVHSLASPKQVETANPNLGPLIESMSRDRTQHIRLYEGPPKGETTKEPERFTTKSVAKKPAKKASNKKAAKKKAASKKSAKKAAKRKR